MSEPRDDVKKGLGLLGAALAIPVALAIILFCLFILGGLLFALAG